MLILCTHVVGSCRSRYQDPFEEYKKRQAKKLQHQAEQANACKPQTTTDGNEELNWFGTKLGTPASNDAVGGSAGGVGKYVNASKKRTVEAAAESLPPEDKKKRKLGFGNFDSW